MSEVIYEFAAPNGVVYRIGGAPDESSARLRARQYFRDEFPDQFTEWERNQPLPGLIGGFTAATRQAAGALPQGAGLQLQERGLPGGQTLRDIGTAIAGEPVPGERLLEADTVLDDLRRRPFQTITTGIGQAAGSVFGTVAPIAAAALAAPAIGVGAGTAALFAGVGAGALLGTTELFEGLRREGIPEERARELAANLGAAIGAAEGGAAGAIVRRFFGGALRREATERLAQIASTRALTAGAREGVRTAGIEGLSEAAGGAARQAVIAAETGQPDLARRAGEVVFEGVLGGIGGGVVGGGLGARNPARARAELEERMTPEERAARDTAQAGPVVGETEQATPAPGPAPLVGDRPEPFATPEEAADYLATARLPPSLTDPGARLAWANARRQAEWENTVQQARPVALSEFTATPPADAPAPVIQTANETFFNNLAQAAATDQISLTRFTPQQIANYAFASRGIQGAKPSKPELDAIVQRLDALVQQNLLEKPSDGLYRISTTDQPAPAATTAPRAPAADPGAPAVNASPAMQTATAQEPAVAQAEQTLTGIAQTGTPVQTPPQVDANLWRAYSLAAGPRVGDPLVLAARDVARARRRPLSLNEFQTFANAWNALPSDTDRAIFMEQARQNARMLGARGGPEVTAPAPAPSAPPPTAAAEPAAAGVQNTRARLNALMDTDENYNAWSNVRDGTDRATFRQLIEQPVNDLAKVQRERITPQAVDAYLKQSKVFANDGLRAQARDILLEAFSSAARTAVPPATATTPPLPPATPPTPPAPPQPIATPSPPAEPVVALPPEVQAIQDVLPEGSETTVTIGDQTYNLRGQPRRPAQPAPEAEPVVVEDPDAEPPPATAPPPPEGEPFPSEAIGEETTPQPPPPPGIITNKAAAAMAGVLPENAVEGQAILNRAINDTFFNKLTRGFGNVFGSPITTLPEWRPELRGVARVARFYSARFTRVNSEVQNLIAKDLGGFSYDDYGKMSRGLIESSAKQKPIKTEGLRPEMVAKMKEVQAAFQMVMTRWIEAATIRYYDPKEAKTAAQATRLAQMWERNPNKNLSEIPDAELKLASPEGFALKQKLEALRNPYYFPMTSAGRSHFIAAYPKGPDGKRKPGAKLVKMVPVNLSKPGAVENGAPDAVALAFEELAAMGYTPDRYYITPQPVEYTRDQEARDMRDNADVFASFAERMLNAVGSNREAKRVLSNMMEALDKSKMESIFRPNQNILMPVTKLNEATYLLSTVPKYAAGLSKMQARKYTDHSFAREVKNLRPSDQAYWRTHRDYTSTPAEAAWVTAGRTITFHAMQGFAPDSALLDSMNFLQNTYPILLKDGGVQGGAITTSTLKQVMFQYGKKKSAWGRDVQKFINEATAQLARNPAEAAALREAAVLGVFDPIHTTEVGGVSDFDIREALMARGSKNVEAKQRALDTMINLSGALKRSAESFNRLVAFLAAYRLAQANPSVIQKVNREESHAFTNAFQYAVNRVDETQTLADSFDRPYFMRAFTGAELATQFFSFTHKITELWLTQWRQAIVGMARHDVALAKAGAMGVLLTTIPMIMMAGVWGIPFADDLREGTEAIIRLLWKDVRNFDDELREASGDGFLARLLTRGLFHAMDIAPLGSRANLDPLPIEEIADWTPLQILGPIGGSSVSKFVAMVGYANQGDYFNAIANFPIMSRFVGNILQGANLLFGTGEYRTPQGAVTVSRDQIAEIDSQALVPVWFRQSIGFPHPKVVDLRDAYRVSREVNTQNRLYATSLNNNLARAQADRQRAMEDRDPVAVREAAERFDRLVIENNQRNQAYERSGERDKIYEINMSTVRRQTREMLYGRVSPEVMGQTGRPAMRAEQQEIQQRYAPR